MNTKTLLMGFAFLSALAAFSPAFAADAAKKTSGSTSTSVKLDSKSLEGKDAEDIFDTVVNEPSEAEIDAAKETYGLSREDFMPEPKEEKPKIKYVYKGQPIGTLRRVIVDDRMDDGYVQGLLQQRGPN